MLVAVALLTFKAGAVNILENPGFESLGASWTVVTPSGAGGNVFEQQNPPAHGGVNVYKNWGCWCSPTNIQSIVQDKPAGAGNIYSASGYIRRPNNDFDANTQNDGFVEVAFLDASGSTLSLYESFRIGVTTPESTEWSFVTVTNKVDPVTRLPLGSVSSLVAPAGTVKVRFAAVLEQRNGGGGAWHYDDLSLDQTAGNLPPSIANLSPSGTTIFNSAAAGVTFHGVSTTTNLYTSGVQLILNGLDVSSGLVVTDSGTPDVSVRYPGLQANRLYAATINVTDGAGYTVSRSVNFDTFVTANFVWEVEDYDYDSNQSFNNPTNTSYLADNSYFGRPGMPGIDYFESGSWGGNSAQAYRETGAGPGVEWASDAARQKFVDAQVLDPAVRDFDVGWVSGLNGDWMNYKRTIPAGSYNIYCRLASGEGGDKRCQLGVVTSGHGTTSQTVSTLGIATIVGGAGWQAWQWAPVLDGGGNLVKLDYATAATVTFRVSADGCNMNFFMLAPARTDLPQIASLYPTGTKPFEPGNTLSFTASSTVANIASGDIHVTLNGNNVDALLAIGSNQTNRTVSLPYLASNAIYTATISVKDSAGTTVSRSLNFDTFSESNFMFEAEDYNFGSGQYIASPVLSTAPGANNYYALGTAAVEAVDISTNPPAAGYGIAYQRPDPVGTEVTSDYLRQAYVAAQVGDPGVKDFNIGWDNSGTWFNYTRDFPAGNYLVYARLAGNGALNATMDLVTGATTSGQTTTPLGTLTGTRPSGGWQAWGWVPLLGPGGSPVVLAGGTKTLRFTTGGNINHNYFMLAPTKNAVSMGIAVGGGNPVLSIPTQAGASYTVQYKTSLTSGGWTFLTMVLGDGTTKTVTDTTVTGGQRYYRAIIE